MPTNRTRKTGKTKNLHVHVLAFLRDEPQELPGFAGYTLWCLRHGMRGLDWNREPENLWREHKAEFLPQFIRKNPGRRPAAWWNHDAPRWNQKFGAWFDGTLMEPRRQLGGKGSAPWDAGRPIVPWYAYGIPVIWDGFDPEDPPCFEAQATYLQRFGVLTAAEQQILRDRPEAFMPETVTWFENKDEYDTKEVRHV
jgi:hypothetical protein